MGTKRTETILTTDIPPTLTLGDLINEAQAQTQEQEPEQEDMGVEEKNPILERAYSEPLNRYIRKHVPNAKKRAELDYEETLARLHVVQAKIRELEEEQNDILTALGGLQAQLSYYDKG
jgi:hypothetical protein